MGRGSRRISRRKVCRSPKCINSVLVSPITREGTCTSVSSVITRPRGGNNRRVFVRIISLFPLLSNSSCQLRSLPPTAAAKVFAVVSHLVGRRAGRCGGIRCESCPVKIPIRTINNALAVRKLQAQVAAFMHTRVHYSCESNALNRIVRNKDWIYSNSVSRNRFVTDHFDL